MSHCGRARVVLLGAALLVACGPGDEAQAPPCPSGEVQDEETAACVPESCGTSTWGLIERSGDTLHVAPWGDNDNDGTEQEPYRTIQKGANEAGEAGGGLVAVAAGTYVTNLELDSGHDGVEIAGRCAELVVIDGSEEEEEPGVLILGGTLELHSLTVAGSHFGCQVVPAGGFGSAVLVARGLVFDANLSHGLSLALPGATVDLQDTVVRNTQLLPDGTNGFGITVQAGADLVARGLLLEGNHSVGLSLDGTGTTAELEDATIRNTQPRTDGTEGRGLSLQNGASLVAQGLLLDNNHSVGLSLSATETTAVLEDATIRNTQPLPDGTIGIGVALQYGASLVARGLLLEENHSIGLNAINSGTSVDLEDTTIRNTKAAHPDGVGLGLNVREGATLSARGLLIEANHSIGLSIRNPGTTVELEDATIRGTRPRTDGTYGRGIEIHEGASLIARGLLLEENHEVGLIASALQTSVDLEDTTIRATQPSGAGTGGIGIMVAEGASLVSRGLLLDNNHSSGLVCTLAEATAELDNTTVLETRPNLTTGYAAGIEVSWGARLVASDLWMEGNRNIGLLIAETGTTVELDQATIRDTETRSDGAFGRGINIQDGASLVAHDLLLDGNYDTGLAAFDADTTVELENTQISGTKSAAILAGGMGIVTQRGASVTAVDLTVEGNEGPGLEVVSDGSIDAWDFALEGNGFAGAIAFNGRLGLHGGTMSGSVLHPSEGGGVGVFAWDLYGSIDIELEDIVFSDLVGPALYLRGSGRMRMSGCEVTDCGTWPWLPGGVLATEGTEAWTEGGETGSFVGLALEGNRFTDLDGDAILLDGSSATLVAHPETGAPNTFADLQGEPLIWQRCGDSTAPEVLDSSMASPICTTEARVLGPLLEYWVWVGEVENVE